MKYKNYYLLLITVLVVITTGCDELLNGKKPNMVVLDMTAVVKATGQNEVIQKKIEETKADLSEQLTETAANLEKELMDVRAKLGKTLSKEEEEKFQKMAFEANQQIRQMQAFAQQKAQQYESGLFSELREQVQPIAEEVARKRGASLVQIMNPSFLWIDTSIDITDEVIAEINARPETFGSTPVDISSEEAIEPTGVSTETLDERVVEGMPAEAVADDMPAETSADEVPAEVTADEVPAEVTVDEMPVDKATDTVPEMKTNDKVN